MEQALHSIDAYPDRTVEIVVHITVTLGEQRREDLVAALEENRGHYHRGVLSVALPPDAGQVRPRHVLLTRCAGACRITKCRCQVN